MRLATYSQRSTQTSASLLAITLLVLAVFQGSGASLSTLQHFAPQLQPIVTLIWFGMYLLAAVGLMLYHGISWIFWLSRYRVLLVILLFGCVASVFWSLDPGISSQRAIHLIGSSLVAIYLGFMIPLTTLITVFSWMLAFILVSSVGAVFLVPEFGIEQYEGTQVWKGILNSKNTLGFWSAIGVLLYLSQLNRPVSLLTKAVLLVLSVLCLVTLFESDSATSQLALIVSGVLCLYLFVAIRFQLGFAQMTVIAVLMSVLAGLALLNINTTELVGRTGDLTGRGEVWRQVWKLILQKPLTGYGYGSIWDPTEATIWMQESLTDFTWKVYHAHNGFLQVASEIGLPLSCIALLMVVQQLIEIFYCQYSRQQVGTLFVLGFVVAYLISNYSEARFLINRELTWMFFLALPISMLRQVSVVMQEPVQDETVAPYGPDDNDDYNETGYATSPDVAGKVTKISRTAEDNADDLDALLEEDLQRERLLSFDPKKDEYSVTDSDLYVKDKFDKILDDNYSDKPISDVDINFDDFTDSKDT